MNSSLSPFVPENLVSRDGFGIPVPRQPAHLLTQAESGAYVRDSSRVPRRRPFIVGTHYVLRFFTRRRTGPYAVTIVAFPSWHTRVRSFSRSSLRDSAPTARQGTC